jgi:uncharacterized protein YukE
MEKIGTFNIKGEVPTGGLEMPGANSPAPAGGLAANPPAGDTSAPPSPSPKGPVTIGAIDWNADEKTLRNQAAAFSAAGLDSLANQIVAYADNVFAPEAKGLEAIGAAQWSVQNLNQLAEELPKVDSALTTLNQFESAMGRLPGGWKGPLSATALPFITGLNQLAMAAGVAPIFDPNKAGDLQEAFKDSSRLRDAMTAAFNGTAGAEVMNNFMSSNPSPLNSDEGVRRLVSTIRQANRAAHAQYDFSISYKGNPRERPGAFSAKFPPSYWQKRAELDYQMNDPKNKALADMIRKQPDLNFKMPGRNETARQYYDKHLKSIGGSQTVIDVLNGK